MKLTALLLAACGGWQEEAEEKSKKLKALGDDFKASA